MLAMTDWLKTGTKIVVLVGAGVALAGCAAQYRNHGYVPTEEELAEVVVGVDTRDSVTETIGAPSSSGVLDESGYYYIATQLRHYGPSQPKPVSRELVAISFDQSGVVSGVERFGLENGNVIPLERRVTSSGIQDKTFLRQLLGSIGNISPGGLVE
ncbi:outer membrane protein assembly factor BamE [Parasedimentitalea marina]|uniref:Outer membrane protein assembly factor BamE n=1 Tax=Parasedimentitalea marina TaxID=2483033 RepID=A0A3T0N261_9RHOB|nr:outer membrane protein assembly factor BamE [Parasedimentitalea marina]AZV78087.1 outer membrane protein assembly factor BamE [Parasedimentitalea marina]